MGGEGESQEDEDKQEDKEKRRDSVLQVYFAIVEKWVKRRGEERDGGRRKGGSP